MTTGNQKVAGSPNPGLIRSPIPRSFQSRIGSWLRRRPSAVVHTLLLLLAPALATGCRVAQGVADLPGQAVRAVSPRQKELERIDFASLQSDVMRFGDEFTAGFVLSAESLRVNGEPLPAAEQLRIKLAYSSEIWGIATEANALSSLLDMTAVVTATRMQLDEDWVSRLYGDSAQRLVETCRTSETNIWGITQSVLNPAEVEALRAAISDWHARNRDPRQSLYLRTGNLFSASTRSHVSSVSTEQGSLLRIINLDPLSGLDPATRELAKTRLFAERATYLMQKMPWMIRWQSELLGYNLAQMPEVKQTLDHAATLAQSAERISRTAQALPTQIQEERRILLEALQDQSAQLSSLASEVELALLAGSQMASNANVALTTFDDVLERFESTAPDPAAPTEPFRIGDYTETARQVDSTAQRLTELLLTFDQTLGSSNLQRVPQQANLVLQQARTDGEALVDYAFRRLLVLAALVCLFIVAGTLLLRYLKPRARATGPPS